MNIPNKHKVPQEALEYWETVLKLVNYASDYKAKIWLRDCLRNTNHTQRADQIFEKEHKGSMDNLYSAIYGLLDQFNANVDKINAICAQRELPQITEPMNLLGLLHNADRRKHYVREAKKLLSQGKIVPLQSLERKFMRKSQTPANHVVKG